MFRRHVISLAQVRLVRKDLNNPPTAVGGISEFQIGS